MKCNLFGDMPRPFTSAIHPQEFNALPKRTISSGTFSPIPAISS